MTSTNFDEDISNLCKKASVHLNALNHMIVNVGKKEMETLIYSFVYSTFNYCPLVCHFILCKSLNKIESALEFSKNTS